MKGLVECGSTQTPAYLALTRLGYVVSREINSEQQYEIWIAEKGDLRFRAGDVLLLLGLHTVWEMRGEDTWQASVEETNDFIEKFPLADYSEEFEGGRQIPPDEDNNFLQSECRSISLSVQEAGKCGAMSKCKNRRTAWIMMWETDFSMCGEHLHILKELIEKATETNR